MSHIKKFMRHTFRRDVAANNIFYPPADICQVCDEKSQLTKSLLLQSLAGWDMRRALILPKWT